MAYEIKRFPYPGTIDADGHVLEPADLWENYLEAKYQPRALRIKVDAEGYEYLEIDQRPSQRTVKGSLGIFGAMGEADLRPRPDRRYADNMPFGSSNAKERLELLERENLDCALLYPTIGLLWEVELQDPGTQPRVHARVQPLDRRLLPRFEGPARADRAADAARPRGLRRRTRTRGARRLQRRVDQSVQSQPGHSRGCEARRAVCEVLRTRRAARNSPDVHAARRGRGDLRLAPSGTRVGRSDLVARHRAAGADFVLFAWHAGSVSAIAARRARSGLRVDRRDARSARCVQRVVEHRGQPTDARPSISAASVSSRATPTRPLRRTRSSTSAPTASCGPPTTRTRIIRTRGSTI